MKIKRAFVTIGTVEWGKVVNFYQGLLQQSPTVYFEKKYAEFQISGLILSIFKPQSSHELEFSQSQRSGFSLCLEVENLTDAIQHLTDFGYALSDQTLKTSHGQEIYAYDPVGNRLILHQSSEN